MPIICLMVRENHKMVREMSGKSRGILWGLMAGHPGLSLICLWINDWVNNREAGDLRCYRAHYDVTIMIRDLTILLSGSNLLMITSIKWGIKLNITEKDRGFEAAGFKEIVPWLKNNLMCEKYLGILGLMDIKERWTKILIEVIFIMVHCRNIMGNDT